MCACLDLLAKPPFCVMQDWVRASAIYYEAYKERSAEAMFNLGYMHEYGAGVPKDLDLARRFYSMAKHANADAALPVYLANAWLRLHEGWEWVRPRLPSGLQAIVLPVNWLFELRPVPGSPAARSFAAVAAGSGVALGSDVIAGTTLQPVLPDGSVAAAGSAAGGAGTLTPVLPPAAAGGAAAKAPGGAASSGYNGQTSDEDDDDADQQQGRGWLWWLSPQLLVWQWDGLVWRLAEATGLGGLSIGALIEEYQDVGETLLLLVLMGVLLLVLRIRRQRQQALEQQVRAALAQGAPPEEQQIAAAIAAQMGLQIPQGPTAVANVVPVGAAGAAAAARSSEAAAAGAGSGTAGLSGAQAGSSSAAARTAAASSSGAEPAPQQNGVAAEEQKQQAEPVAIDSSSMSSQQAAERVDGEGSRQAD
jgi:hypothetical protein